MDNSNYYKLKYLTYKIKYLKKMYGGKLKCTCNIINKDTKEVTKETCECEVHDDKPLDKKKQSQKEKIEEQIKKLQDQLEKLKS